MNIRRLTIYGIPQLPYICLCEIIQILFSFPYLVVSSPPHIQMYYFNFPFYLCCAYAPRSPDTTSHALRNADNVNLSEIGFISSRAHCNYIILAKSTIWHYWISHSKYCIHTENSRIEMIPTTYAIWRRHVKPVMTIVMERQREAKNEPEYDAGDIDIRKIVFLAPSAYTHK